MLDGSLPWQTLSFISCLFMQWSVLTVQPNLRSVKGNQGYLKSNLLSNSLQYLNCKINIDWPNLSFQIYKIKCKGLFLWIKRCLKNSKISMMIKLQNIMLDINWENFYNMWNNLIRLIFFIIFVYFEIINHSQCHSRPILIWSRNKYYWKKKYQWRLLECMATPYNWLTNSTGFNSWKWELFSKVTQTHQQTVYF